MNEIELICEECGGDFTVEHEMGFEYIPQYCVFCGVEIYIDEAGYEQDINRLEQEW